MKLFLRALALLIGIPLLLFGLLAVVIAVGMVGNPGQQGGAAAVVAQVIVVVLMAGVAITGAALTWLGLRKRSKPAVADTDSSARIPAAAAAEVATVAPPQQATGGWANTTIASPDVAAAPNSAGLATMAPPAGQHESESLGYAPDPDHYDEQAQETFDSSPRDDEATFRIGPTGKLVGKCGPKMSGQSHYYWIGGLVIATGFAVMIGLQVAPGAADPATAGKVGLLLGGGLVLFGGAMIALQLMQAPQIISLYDDRLEEESGSKLRTVPLSQIASLHLQEFYEHRFAPQRFLVTVHVRGERKLKFSTALGGDAELIVRCLAEIAPDVQVREFMG